MKRTISILGIILVALAVMVGSADAESKKKKKKKAQRKKAAAAAVISSQQKKPPVNRVTDPVPSKSEPDIGRSGIRAAGKDCASIIDPAARQRCQMKSTSLVAKKEEAKRAWKTCYDGAYNSCMQQMRKNKPNPGEVPADLPENTCRKKAKSKCGPEPT